MLAELIDYIAAFDDVWFATHAQVVDLRRRHPAPLTKERSA